MCEAAAGVFVSPMGQVCQVPLPARLIVHRDCFPRIEATHDNDLLIVRVGDGAGIPARDEVTLCNALFIHVSRCIIFEFETPLH